MTDKIRIGCGCSRLDLHPWPLEKGLEGPRVHKTWQLFQKEATQPFISIPLDACFHFILFMRFRNNYDLLPFSHTFLIYFLVLHIWILFSSFKLLLRSYNGGIRQGLLQKVYF